MLSPPISLRLLLLLVLWLLASPTWSLEYANCRTLSIIKEYKFYYNINGGVLEGQLTAPRLSKTNSNWLALGLGSSTTDAMINGGSCSDIMMVSSSGACPPVSPAEDNCLDPSCNSCVDDLWVCEKPSENADSMLSGARDSSQDWVIDEIIETATNMTVTFHRNLNTGDSEDREITIGNETTIIWAMGHITGDTYLKHEPTTRGFVKLDFGEIYACNESLPVNGDFSFTSPEGDWTASWDLSSDGEDVTFSVKAQTEGWAAIGFSNTNQMPGADVVLAHIGTDGVVRVFDRMATGRFLPGADDENGGTTDIRAVSASSEEEDGEMYVSFQFTRKLDTGDSRDVALVAGTQQYILYAKGEVDEGVPQYHSNKGIALIDFFAGSGATVVVPVLEKAHGSLMMAGWIILLSTGAVVGHKYRPFTDKWFPTHVGLQVSGSVIVLIGFILIFVEKGSFIMSAHAVIGIIVFCFMFTQIALGITSNRVPSVRHTVHIIHRWLGRLTLVMAFVNIMLGYSMVEGGLALYIVCAVWFLVALVLFWWPLKSQGDHGSIDLDDPNKAEKVLLTFASKLLFGLTLAAFCIFAIILITLFVVTTGSTGRSSTASYTMANYSIPNQMTSYKCITIDFDQSNPIDVSKISPVVDNSAAVHHMILFGTDTLLSNSEPVWDCTQMPNGQPLWVWAVGGGDFVLPEGVGLRLGPNSYRFGVLQFHYDLSWSADVANANQIDSSGVKLYFHDELQPNEMGIVRLGVPMSEINLPANTPNQTLVGTCSSSTTQALGESKLTVFSTVLHMHKLGTAISLEQRRDGVFHSYFAETSQWDFNNQQFYKSSNVIEAGDALVTRCTWDTTGVATITRGGEDSTSEMCFAFIFYYPLLPVAVQSCGA